MMPLQSVATRIHVRPDSVAEMTAAGIVLPPDAQERPIFGEVTSVGSRCEDVAVGDRVMYGQYAGTPVDSIHGSALVMNEHDVIAIVEQDG